MVRDLPSTGTDIVISDTPASFLVFTVTLYTPGEAKMCSFVWAEMRPTSSSDGVESPKRHV